MIFIAGATGFVGGNLVDDLLAKGFKLKCLVRSDRAGEALSSRGVEVVRGDITAPGSLKGVLKPEDFVIHLVGIIEEKGKTTFQAVHADGTANLVAEGKRAGVRHFFYQSAIGADRDSWSGYLRTKAEAEQSVIRSGLSFTIFRPSLIIGPWDGFTKKMAEVIKLSPVLPIPGEGNSKFQPVFIKDWIRCMETVLEEPEKFRSTYDIGGPEQLTYMEIVEALAAAMGREKPVFRIPMGLMKISASLLATVLSSPPVTGEQLRLLDAVERNFGFRPMRYKDALKEFVRP
jgi:uncharacterized protein YbjT (DUF2867 family)